MLKRTGPLFIPIGGLILGLVLTVPFITSAAPRYAAPPIGTDVKYNPYNNVPDWVYGPLPYTLTQTEQENPELAARNVLNRFAETFGITDAYSEFKLIKIETDTLGQTHVRLQQVKDGVPVSGKVMLVHLSENEALGINGDYQPALTLATTPILTAAAAQTTALAADDGVEPHVYAPPQLMIWVDDATQAAYLTWFVKVEARVTLNTGYFIDANTGDLRHITPLTASGLYREVYDQQLKESIPGKLLSTEGTIPRDPAGAAVYKNAGTVYNYFADNFGRDSYDDNGGEVYLIIHSPELGNSYWNGQALFFGDKDDFIANKDDAYVLDIMAHEFTHAVTQYSAALEYETQSGALNESFSDVFAVMVDREDWHLFEDNTASPPVPKPWLRDMQDPSLGGDYNPNDPRDGFGQPSTVGEYADLPNTRQGDWGGVHVNSGIPNHVLYLAATGSSRGAAEQIWYRALTVYLTNRSDFSDFAQAIQQSASDLYGANSAELTAIRNSLRQTGLLAGQAEPTAVPTSTPQTQVNPTPTPVVTTGCTELVGNGTFESSKAAPWVEQTNLNSPIILDQFPHTGRKSAWLGGTDQETYQYVYQDVSVAANVRGVNLTYWYYVEENKIDDSAPDAIFDTVLADPASGNVIATLQEFFSSDPTDNWTQSTIDLSSYAGKKIRLAFTADMARGNLSNFFVDDVSIAACSTSAQTPTTGGATAGVTGIITDSRTGKPIVGAEFYVLKVSVAEASADGRLSSSEILAYGITDNRGQYRLDTKLPRGQSYNVIILAAGYKTISIDGALEITSTDPDPIVQDVVMQKR